MRSVISLAVVVLLLAGCGDPLQDVERLADVPLAQGADTAAVAPGPAEQADAPGFLGTLFGGGAEPAPPGTVPALSDAADPVAPLDATGPTGTPDVVPVAAPAAQPGFFGRLFGGGDAAPPAATAETAVPVAASATPAAPPGTLLPYGQVASACGSDAGTLGTATGSAGGFTLYDSNPSTTALRTHYVTGFDDGCPRQFSAALALFGNPSSHELVRYLPGAQDRPYSATDRAYEDIKASVCGAASGQPCGSRIERLSRNLTFVTVYETFGTNPEWSEILLYDGQVAATAFEGG
jgi:hypothetical protein